MLSGGLLAPALAESVLLDDPVRIDRPVLMRESTWRLNLMKGLFEGSGTSLDMLRLNPDTNIRKDPSGSFLRRDKVASLCCR